LHYIRYGRNEGRPCIAPNGEVLAAYGNPLAKHAAALNHPKWHLGQKAANPDWPTVLLCAHVAGHQLFGGERSLSAMDRCPSGLWLAQPELCRYPHPSPHFSGLCVSGPLAAALKLGRQRLIHSRELISLDDKLRDRIDVPTSQIISYILQRSDWIVGNSQATCRLFHRQGRTLYVPNAVSPEDFGMGNKFGIVSSNIPTKGVADFVEVTRRAASQAPQPWPLLQPSAEQW